MGEVSPAARDRATVVERVRVPPPTRRPGPTGRGAAFRARRFRVRIPGTARRKASGWSRSAVGSGVHGGNTVAGFESRAFRAASRRRRRTRPAAPGDRARWSRQVQDAWFSPRRTSVRIRYEPLHNPSPVGPAARTSGFHPEDDRFDSGTGYGTRRGFAPAAGAGAYLPHARVAQPDRASPRQGERCGFESRHERRAVRLGEAP